MEKPPSESSFLDITDDNIELAAGNNAQVHPWFADPPVAEEERLFVKRGELDLSEPVKEDPPPADETKITKRAEDEADEDTTLPISEAEQISPQMEEEVEYVKQFVEDIVDSDIGANLIFFKEGLAENCVSTISGLKWYQVG